MSATIAFLDRYPRPEREPPTAHEVVEFTPRRFPQTARVVFPALSSQYRDFPAEEPPYAG